MKVFITNYAKKNFFNIVNYYKDNISTSMANNIKDGILNSIKILSENPNIGKEEELLKSLNENHKYLISKNYKIIYKVVNNQIFITDIFDVRQDPSKIRLYKN